MSLLLFAAGYSFKYHDRKTNNRSYLLRYSPHGWQGLEGGCFSQRVRRVEAGGILSGEHCARGREERKACFLPAKPHAVLHKYTVTLHRHSNQYPQRFTHTLTVLQG